MPEHRLADVSEMASKIQMSSYNGELAALRCVAAQRLLEQAEDAEVRIRPFVDHDESAFAAAGTDRSVVFGRQLGRYCMQVYENTHGRVL